MTFYEHIQSYDWALAQKNIYAKTAEHVRSALNKEVADIDDFQALISPAAEPFLEQMAHKSHLLTRQRFGNTIQLYAPLYMSNVCNNSCVYCGFNRHNRIPRKVLSMSELELELLSLKKEGFEHLLLVSGEDHRACGLAYLKAAIHLAKKYFAQVSIEVQPLLTEEYANLKAEGLHAVYVYQETYHEENYKIYHPQGKKANYKYRLETPERIGQAGIHKVGLGVLLGLEDWRTDSFFTALHLQYLEKHFWQMKLSLSFPRLRPHVGGFEPNSIIKHKQLLQLMCAYRLLNEQVEVSLSTREGAHFRNNVIPLCVTTMSAGSKTEPGGYSHPNEALEQFAVNDERSPEQVVKSINEHGYEVVWKDWEGYL